MENLHKEYHDKGKTFKKILNILSKKVKAAVENSLNVIFCIGEELSERESGNHFEIIKNQLTNALIDLNNSEIKNIVIAYEPVWAIGTGMTANNLQIQEMHEFIRELINKKFGNQIADNIRILYGGSVKPNNAKEIFSLNDVDGGLIGGAALNFSVFHSIINAANG